MHNLTLFYFLSFIIFYLFTFGDKGGDIERGGREVKVGNYSDSFFPNFVSVLCGGYCLAGCCSVLKEVQSAVSVQHQIFTDLNFMHP